MTDFRPLDVLRAVRDRRDLDGIDKAVLGALVLRGDKDGRSFPSHLTISEDTGFAVRSVQRSIDRLRDAGLIAVEQRMVEGRRERDSNVYRVVLDVVSPGHDVVPESHHVAPHSHQGGVRETPQVVSESHQGGVTVAEYLPIDLPNGTAQGRSHAPLREEASATSSRAPKETKSRRKPRTRAPASDAEDAEVGAWCLRWAVPPPETSEQAAKFLDHARSNDRLCADWGAAWRNWSRHPLAKVAATAAQPRVRNPVQGAGESPGWPSLVKARVQ